MARSVPWRRTCSDNVSWRQDQAMSATIYILRETGPTGFLVKEDGESKKFRVFLGDPHTCTCPVYMKEKDLCKHICWLLLKKFRVSRQNPASWQLGLVEREVNEIIDLRRNANRPQPVRPVYPTKATGQTKAEIAGDGRPVIEQRELGEDDVCPICQEELLSKHMPVTYCKYGCGNSIHIKCMKVWADHQMNSGESVIKCPFCREDFGPFSLLKEEVKNTASAAPPPRTVDRHYGVMCKRCRSSPIQGKCYKCSTCFDFHLCQSCFNTTFHNEHSFVFRQKTNQRWRPVQRGSGTALPSAVVNNLLARDITDDDYDLLLQLDGETANSGSDIPEHVIKSFPIEKVRDNSSLMSAGQQCCVCLRAYQVGQSVRRLPCRHKFHQDCIDNWLLHQRPTCPVDGQVVWDPVTAALQEQERREKNRERQTGQSSEQQQRQQGQNQLEIPGIGFARQETASGSTNQRVTKGPANAKRSKAPHNSTAMNFELSGTSYTSAQERLMSNNTLPEPSVVNQPAHSRIQGIIDRIPNRIRQRVSSQSSLGLAGPSIPSSHSSPDVASLNLGRPEPSSAPPLMRRPPAGYNADSDPETVSRKARARNKARDTRQTRSSSGTRARSTSRDRANSNQRRGSQELYLGSGPPVARRTQNDIQSRVARQPRPVANQSQHTPDRDIDQETVSQELFLGSGPPLVRQKNNVQSRVARQPRPAGNQSQHTPDRDIALTGNALQGLNIGDLLG